jgi:hypothetical protein
MGSRAEAKQEHRTFILRDGTVCAVRPIRPGDASALQRFHSRLSERSIYLRFFDPILHRVCVRARPSCASLSFEWFRLATLWP